MKRDMIQILWTQTNIMKIMIMLNLNDSIDNYIETLQDSRVHDAHDIIGYMLLVVVLIVKMTN